jgi:hypothetical protein
LVLLFSAAPKKNTMERIETDMDDIRAQAIPGCKTMPAVI